MNILIIDDDPYVLELLRDILESLKDVHVEEARDCFEGLSLLKSSSLKFDVILVDWQTPRMTGIEFVSEVRKDPNFSGQLMMMVTGLNNMEDVQKALEIGANEYLMKPFVKQMLFDKLRLLGFDIPSE